MKNFEYKKSLGQNFLIDQNIIRKIIDSINLKNNALIIEIGPGSGALTRELVKLDAQVVCFEIDKRLEETLNEIEANNLEIYYEDFLKINLEDFLKDKKYDNLYFIANLPYYITTPIINKIHLQANAYEMIFMIQKEVADRFIATPGHKEYNSLSVFLQYNYNISKLVLVSKNCFYPKPKVDSMVVKFESKINKIEVKNEENFYKLVKDSFKYKRKNIKNNLSNYDLKKLEEELKKHGKDLTVRAENLSIEEFASISNNLN